MTYQYDNHHHNPPAPVVNITIHIPGDSTKHVKIDALLDTGADITCLPRAIIKALGAERASVHNVAGINGSPIGPADGYFLEFEIATKKRIYEVIAVGDEPILGRNIINEFIIELQGPIKKLEIRP